MSNHPVPKKRYRKYKRNHHLEIWEYINVVEHDYDYKVTSNKEYKYVLIEKKWYLRWEFILAILALILTALGLLLT